MLSAKGTPVVNAVYPKVIFWRCLLLDFALKINLSYEVLEMHGNIHNLNAKKDKTKDSFIQMRVSREQKAKWVKQSPKLKMKLIEWITRLIYK